MTSSDQKDDDSALPGEDKAQPAEDGALDVPEKDEQEEGDEKPELNLGVEVEPRSACERHIKVSIPREDIDRYLDREFSELMSTAQVPGFRPGRAPRKLVEARFRKDIRERVKNVLLMDSIAQISDSGDLSAISEPELKPESVELPPEGPMTFEFDLEVRPEFAVPKWKGLTIDRPVREFTEADVDAALANILASHGQLVPKDSPAEPGDYITTRLTFRHDGRVLSSSDEEVIRIRPVLSFRDGKIPDFQGLMVGVQRGETRTGHAEISTDSPNELLRGQKVEAVFEVLEVKRLEMPELTAAFLEALGGFDSEAELRDAVRDNLERQLEYRRHRAARDQITAALTVAAHWDLPQGLLHRQAARELQRAVLELRSSGFSEDEIRAYQNELRQNSLQSTARALKEHFILEKIAEEEKITDEEADYEAEIRLIATQSGQTPRRVRARLEKAGGMDVLRNQIIERKVIKLILDHAAFREVPYQPEQAQAEAVDRSATGQPDSEIPEVESEPPHGSEEEKSP
jgi:trigger factor